MQKHTLLIYNDINEEKRLKVTYKEQDFKIELTDFLFLYFHIMNSFIL